MIAWAIGTRAAPNTPCMSRNRTICTRFSATPQSMDAIVKPMMLISR
jgi:hypothetical protein